MFRIPPVTLRDPRELVAYAVLGLGGGVAAPLFAKALKKSPAKTASSASVVADAAPRRRRPMVGVIGYFGFPQVMGAGYQAIDQAMHAQFAWKMLLALALLKIIATTLSFSSGTPGGCRRYTGSHSNGCHQNG